MSDEEQPKLAPGRRGRKPAGPVGQYHPVAELVDEGELAFWEKAYCAALVRPPAIQALPAAIVADHSVEDRRRRVAKMRDRGSVE